MRKLASRLLAGLLVGLWWTNLALADNAPPKEIPFDGGVFSLTTEDEDGGTTLAYDGTKIASQFSISFDRVVEVDGVKAALFTFDDCSTEPVIVAWKATNGKLNSATMGEGECGSGSRHVAVTGHELYFLPSPLPGYSATILAWSPKEGARTVGMLSFAPQPGTQWSDLDPARVKNFADAMRIEPIYAAAKALHGSSLPYVMADLKKMGSLPSGVLYASGCVEEGCGCDFGFMAIDPGTQKLYYYANPRSPPARATSPGTPPLDTWPTEIRDAMREARKSE